MSGYDLQEFLKAVEPHPGSPRSPVSPTTRLIRPPQSAESPALPAAGSHSCSDSYHPVSSVKPVTLASSLLMLVSIDEPKSAQATFTNMLFKSVDIRPFVLVVDYHPVKVGPSIAYKPYPGACLGSPRVSHALLNHIIIMCSCWKCSLDRKTRCFLLRLSF
jgi:hypothetical protein